MGHPRPLFHLFSIFFLQTILINVKKFPSSIRCRDENSQPSDYESLPLTTIPMLLLKYFNSTFLKRFFLFGQSEFIQVRMWHHVIRIKHKMVSAFDWLWSCFFRETWIGIRQLLQQSEDRLKINITQSIGLCPLLKISKSKLNIQNCSKAALLSHDILKNGRPAASYFYYFPSFQTIISEKSLDFSGIWTQVVKVLGRRADH